MLFRSLRPHNPEITLVNIETADELLAVCENAFGEADVAILSAAVADYRPSEAADLKIKKSGESLTLDLVENPDILRRLGELKRKDQYLVGFALETNNAEENAREKLNKKNCDLIVLNKPGKDSGFKSDTNEVVLIDKAGEIIEIELKSKREIAEDIIRHIHHSWSVVSS